VAIGSAWPITLELPSDTVRLTGRVVSCRPLDAPAADDPARPRSYAVAMAFVEPPSGAVRTLERVCREYQPGGAAQA
jgi:hypothetical protein